jgi:hypothetical protein
MARDRSIANRKDRGDAAAFEADVRMSHGIHAAVKPVQVTSTQPSLNRVAMKTRVAQLIPAAEPRSWRPLGRIWRVVPPYGE